MFGSNHQAKTYSILSLLSLLLFLNNDLKPTCVAMGPCCWSRGLIILLIIRIMVMTTIIIACYYNPSGNTKPLRAGSLIIQDWVMILCDLWSSILILSGHCTDPVVGAGGAVQALSELPLPQSPAHRTRRRELGDGGNRQSRNTSPKPWGASPPERGLKSVLMSWMHLKPIEQSEISQKQKCGILTHVYGI